jgi:hypothetical protein
MRNRKPAVCWRLTGQGDDRCDLLRSELRRGAGPLVVCEDRRDKLLEVLILGPLRLSSGQRFRGSGPTVAPPTHSLSIYAQLFRLVSVFPALGRHQHNAAPLDDLLWRRLSSREGFENPPLSGGNYDGDRSLSHASLWGRSPHNDPLGIRWQQQARHFGRAHLEGAQVGRYQHLLVAAAGLI